MSSGKIDAAQAPDRPGRIVQRVLQGMPETDRLPFLAYLAQKARQAHDTEILEAVQDYRMMREGKPFLRLVRKIASE